MDFILNNLDIIIFLLLVVLGYVAGSFNEKRHYKSIEAREAEYLRFQVISAEAKLPPEKVQSAFLVKGNAVISVDYFKRLLAGFRNIFGGNVGAYETLADRARREALLRMKKEALDAGADIVANLRLETAPIGKGGKKNNRISCLEVVAYGTAIVLNRA